ncbi:hypothetical protein [Roseateles sp. MS654]|uniref:hypothetical protein n=1 Tax=Roseateles sp. MS654 TaxID=3412685 RepID=UPI003C2C30D4
MYSTPTSFGDLGLRYRSMADPSQGRLNSDDLHRAMLDGDANAVGKMFERLVKDSHTNPMTPEGLERTVLAENWDGLTALRGISSAEAIEAYMLGVRSLVEVGALSRRALLRILSHVPPGSDRSSWMTPLCGMAGLRVDRDALSKTVDQIERFHHDRLLTNEDLRALLCEESKGGWSTPLDQAVLHRNDKGLKRLLDCCMKAVRSGAMEAGAILTGLGFDRLSFAERQADMQLSGHPLYVPFVYNYHETMQVVLDAFSELIKMGKLTTAEAENLLRPLLKEEAPKAADCRPLLETRLAAWGLLPQESPAKPSPSALQSLAHSGDAAPARRSPPVPRPRSRPPQLPLASASPVRHDAVSMSRDACPEGTAPKPSKPSP